MKAITLLTTAVCLMWSFMAKELDNSGVSASQSKILAGYFEDAASRLAKVVLNPQGMTDSSRDYRRARAAEQIQQIRKITDGLLRNSNAWLGEQLPTAYREGLSRAHKQARDVGVSQRDGVIQGRFSRIDERTISVIALDTAESLRQASEGMASRAGSVLMKTADMGVTRAELNSVLATGVIDGKPREAVRELREMLKKVHGERVTIIDKNGNPKDFKAGYYADLVVRTQTRQAVEKGRHARLGELGLDLVSVVGRISDNFCSAFLGMVFSLSGNSDRYPALDSIPGGGPPFHPNCSKSTRPFVERLASETQISQAAGLDDARRLLRLNPAEAQKQYKGLQLRPQITKHYARTASALFGGVN